MAEEEEEETGPLEMLVRSTSDSFRESPMLASSSLSLPEDVSPGPSWAARLVRLLLREFRRLRGDVISLF